MMHVACRMSHVACRMSHVACRMSDVGCRMSHVACRIGLLGPPKVGCPDCGVMHVGCSMPDVGCPMSFLCPPEPSELWPRRWSVITAPYSMRFWSTATHGTDTNTNLPGGPSHRGVAGWGQVAFLDGTGGVAGWGEMMWLHGAIVEKPRPFCDRSPAREAPHGRPSAIPIQ